MPRLLLSLLFVIPCVAQTRTVALTFDDLPPEDETINKRILDALVKHRAWAIAFVNETKVAAPSGEEMLRDWVIRGLDLGNHTYSHRDLNQMTVDEFKDEVIRGEKTVAQLAGKPKYFRFPFNHSGDTKEKHDAVASFLAERGYRVATCTIDNEDYRYSHAYDAMRSRKDEAAAARLRVEYLAYTATEIDYYAQLHVRVFGREIPHVMLLHSNRLNAELIDQLLQIFEDKQYRFVTLDAAQSDAVYKTPDTYVTKFGPMWGYRWAAELGIKVNGRLETEPSSWILSYADQK
ncbi:MAG: polysaccharide deacetylase family protein [Bryobacteraceae bacterium]|jgi:peptidoglycan/xylan/chitin deacetylase (PgdA/CDA1 family)